MEAVNSLNGGNHLNRKRDRVLHVWLNAEEERQLIDLFNRFSIYNRSNRGAAFRRLLGRLHEEHVRGPRVAAWKQPEAEAEEQSL
jgi:hypothetical protein